MAKPKDEMAREYARKMYTDENNQLIAYHAFLRGFSLAAHRKNEPQPNIPRDYIDREDYKTIFELWLDYKKKEKREPYASVRTEKIAYDKLVLLSGGNADRAREIVLQSMGMNYSGLFPLKLENRYLMELSETQKKFRDYLFKIAPLVAMMQIQPTDEELCELRKMPTDELERILKEMNNKKYLSSGRNSVYQTIQEVKAYGK